jgi:hypothetical protein
MFRPSFGGAAAGSRKAPQQTHGREQRRRCPSRLTATCHQAVAIGSLTFSTVKRVESNFPTTRSSKFTSISRSPTTCPSQRSVSGRDQGNHHENESAKVLEVAGNVRISLFHFQKITLNVSR